MALELTEKQIKKLADIADSALKADTIKAINEKAQADSIPLSTQLSAIEVKRKEDVAKVK